MKLRWIPRRMAAPSRRIWLTGLALIGITILAAGLAIWQRHEEVIAQSREAMSKLSVVLAEQTARSIQAIDLVLLETQARIAADAVATRDDFARLAASPGFSEFFSTRRKTLPQLQDVALVAADGTLLNNSWRASLGSDLSSRECYRHFRDTSDPGVFISSPGEDPISGRRTFFIARRINGPLGEFLGVVVGVAAIQYFEEFYHNVTGGEGETVSLFRRDGTLLAHYPPGNLTTMKMPAASPWHQLVGDGGGTYLSPGYLRGVPRIVGARPVREYPLAVTSGIALAPALAGWRRETVIIAFAAFAAIIGYTLLFRALAIRAGKLERRTAQLARSSAALCNSEERFRDFATTSSDWFWETDKEHRFTYISDGIKRFGQNPDTRVGRSRWDNAADYQSDPYKWEDHRATLDRHEAFRDFVYARKAGDDPEQIVSVSGKPFFDADGRFLGYRGTASDVTDKINAERRLLEAKMAAEAGNIAKSQFLANMSHELRTPLNAIIGFAEMLAAGMAGELGERQHEYTDIIAKSGRHLLAVINDVLDLAKIDAGKFTLQEDVLQPAALIKECVEIVSEHAQAGSVRLAIEGEPPRLALVADARRLKQVLLNLLSNATKFTEPGGCVTVDFRRADSGDVEFRVRDTGLGMTAAEVAVALQPFGQVDGGLSRRHEGTGLGLPLARSLVELHGGLLEIDSEKGRGTTVTIRLPASRVVEEPAAAPGSAAEIAA